MPVDGFDYQDEKHVRSRAAYDKLAADAKGLLADHGSESAEVKGAVQTFFAEVEDIARWLCANADRLSKDHNLSFGVVETLFLSDVRVRWLGCPVCGP